MMDNFKEDIVGPRSNALAATCSMRSAGCSSCSSVAYALMMLQVVMVQFSVLTLVTVAMLAAACAVLLFFIKDQLKLEYEYTFTERVAGFCEGYASGQAQRTGQHERQKRFRMRPRCARQRFRRFLSMKDVEKKNWFLQPRRQSCSISTMSRKTRNT